MRVAFRGNPTWLRYGSYFSLVFGIVFGFLTITLFRHEYLAQHWPVAPGRVLAAEIKSRSEFGRMGQASSTIYWVKFAVLFDVSPDECRPREPWIFKGSGRTECWATFNTLEGSQTSANKIVERHRKNSHAQFHYEPHGVGVRFAGEPPVSIYPWAKVVGTFAVFGFAFALARLARWQGDVQSGRLAQSQTPDLPTMSGQISGN